MAFRSAIYLITGLLLVGAAHADAADETSFSGNYLAGRAAGRMHDDAAVADFFAAALKQDAGNPVLIERLFQSNLTSGNIAKAEVLAPQVVAGNSQHRMARIVLGLKELHNRRYPEARVQFNESAYTPVGELTSALLNAWAFAGEGSLNAALKELSKLDSQESFASYKAFHAALIADYLNQSLRADSSYKKAYELAGNSLRIVQAYGNFLERTGHAGEAEKIYLKFLAGGQRNVLVEANLADLKAKKKASSFITTPAQGAAEALFSIAAALNSEQSADAALMYAQLATSLSPDQPVIQSLIGDIYTDIKSSDAAIVAFDKVSASSTLRNYADTQIAINLQRLNKPQDAIAKLQAVLGKDPNNIDALLSIGGLFRNTGNLTGAIEIYSKAIALQKPDDENRWQIYFFRGTVYDLLKDYEKSEADFRASLAISKDQPSVLNYLGYSLIDRGQKLDEAIGLVKKAVDLKPNDGDIVDSLGWAYYKMGDYDQAVNYLERAVELKAGDPALAEHLGDAYWHSGRTLEAHFQWQHAKDNKPEPNDLLRVEKKLKDGLTELPIAKPADKTTPSKATAG